MRFTSTLLVAVTIVATCTFAQPQTKPAGWIGIGYAVDPDAPGVQVVTLPYRSPAEAAGILLDDIIIGIDGERFASDPGNLEQLFRARIAAYEIGDSVRLEVVRNGKAGSPIDIAVEIEERPVGIGGRKEFPSFEDVERDFPPKVHPVETLAGELIDEFGIAGDYGDLRARLARLGASGDQFRLSRVAYLQKEPFQLQTVGEATFAALDSAMRARDLESLVLEASRWLDAEAPTPPRLSEPRELAGHLEQLVDVLGRVRDAREAALARLGAEDRQYLEENLDDLFTTFAAEIYLDADDNRQRWQRNARLLTLVEQVDLASLAEGAVLWTRLTDPRYLSSLESAVRAAWEDAGRPGGAFINDESPLGRIVVAGTEGTWHREDAAILIDLGGRDFYTNNAGSPRTGTMPAALLIDFEGDDAYEATFDWSQGAAAMGYGLLIDRQGDDNYVGRDWTQGATVLGASVFLDESGADVYRSRQYSQGAAAWGLALHVDSAGDDRYEAGQLAQGVGMPGGVGWLLNGTGNDSYYAKGLRPTNYGDPGIFDSWSQGTGVGFRGLHSGGVAILYDGDGRDRYEAGNFSQGGGYYYGIGLLHDGGDEADIYDGSRYAQGFAAHEAIGYFNEAGGDDSYRTRHGAAQGIAWDESIVLFIDREGDDVYSAPVSFYQAASAHNGLSLFLDLGGHDRFGIARASAGPNDYHGGTSLSLFVAAGGSDDIFDSDRVPAVIRMNGEFGVFANLSASLDETVDSERWRELIDPTP